MAEPPAPSGAKPVLHMVACTVWAAMVGMSVPLGMVLSIFLNSKADESHRSYHAFFVTNLAVAMGGVELIPLAVRAEKPMALPKRWWHLAGGLCTLPAFFTIFAGSALGSQVVLVVQLAALLTTYLLIDFLDGRVQTVGPARLAALLVVFGGAALAGAGSGGPAAGGPEAAAMLLLVAVAGTGFALQAKCNSALAQDVGSAARASVVSACVNMLFGVPIDLYISLGRNIWASFDAGFWYLWPMAGFQSAFYIGSMAYLPGVLGFTRCYVVTLTAQMTTSLAVDANGLTGEVVPVSATRVCSLLAVLAGAITFNVCGKPEGDASKSGNSLPADPEAKEDSQAGLLSCDPL